MLATLLCVLAACSGETISRPAAELLPRINEDPRELPRALEDGDEVVMLLLGVDDHGRVSVDGPPIPVDAHSMRFARAMTERRTAPPKAWALVREEGADVVRYWIPFDPSALIRANIRAGDEPGHSPHLERVPVLFSSLRVPFFARAEVEFVRADGSPAGTFRFGGLPTEPMEEVR